MARGDGRLDVRLLGPALAGWAAVWCGLYVAPGWSIVLGLGCALGAVLMTRRPSVARRTLALGLAIVGLLTLSTGMRGLTAQTGPIDELARERATVTVTGVLTTDPRIVRTRGDRPTGREESPLVVTRLRVEEVTGRGQHARVRTSVVVFADQRWTDLRWRDQITVTGRLGPSDSPDTVAALQPLGPARRTAQAPGVLRGIESVRADLRSATDPLPDDARGLVPALVIGDVSRVPEPLTDAMRATGMTHLTAVSGANVTILLMAALWVCGWLRVPRRARLPVALTVLGLFVLLCRPEPSVARAALMGVVGLLATSSGRPRSAAPALAAAIVTLLVLDPSLAATYGFALSVLATLGLVLFARSWGGAIAARLPDRLRWLGEPLAIPVAAQVMCTPVIVLLQGGVPLVGIPANVLAAPLVAPATLGGVVVVLLAPWAMPVAQAVAWGAAAPTELIAQIAHVAASVPGGVLPWSSSPLGALALVLLTATVVLCGAWCVELVRRRPVVLLAAVALVVAALWPLPQPGWPAPGWVLVACDVGQGDGAVVRTSAGRVVVIDVGPEPGPIVRCLDDLDVASVDAVVLTHFHADHVGGLQGVLDSRPVREIITTPFGDGPEEGSEEPSAEPDVRRAAAARGVPMTTVRAGDDLRWGGVRARVLWPQWEIRAGSAQNNASVVLDLRVRGARLVLLGDLEQEAQAQVARIMRAEGGPPVDAMKVAHHGSGNHEPGLLRELRATYALVSVGADNDYGHPAPSLLTSLHSTGSRVVRTDRHGDIAVAVTRNGVTVVTRNG